MQEGTAEENFKSYSKTQYYEDTKSNQDNRQDLIDESSRGILRIIIELRGDVIIPSVT
ncbi:MAG: hypothetical protein J7K13_00935 [Thermoplasmata archaeon]|nr:hypothetical protein [Thermoplasmata archaeon]